VRKGVAVARDLLHRVVTRDVPETAVLLVPRHRAPAAEVGVDLLFVQVELVGVVIESDDHVGTDVGTAHWAIFAFLGILSPGEVARIEDWAAGATIGGRAIPDLPDLPRMR
jgi:hypothetical protein